GELAAREALLDELADLVLEQAHQLGSPERHLAVAMVDRANLGGEPLAVALQLGRSVPGHASNHPATSTRARAGPRNPPQANGRRCLPEAHATRPDVPQPRRSQEVGTRRPERELPAPPSVQARRRPN